MLEWFSIGWIIVAVGALLASAPIAWRVLMTGTMPKGSEATVLAWVAMLLILSIPAGIAIVLCRSRIRSDQEFSKWITEDFTI